MVDRLATMADRWWREKEGVLAVWLVAVWMLVSFFYLYLLLTDRLTQDSLQFYASFSYLPGTSIAGIFIHSGVKAIAQRPQVPQPPQMVMGCPNGYQQATQEPQAAQDYQGEDDCYCADNSNKSPI